MSHQEIEVGLWTRDNCKILNLPKVDHLVAVASLNAGVLQHAKSFARAARVPSTFGQYSMLAKKVISKQAIQAGILDYQRLPPCICCARLQDKTDLVAHSIMEECWRLRSPDASPTINTVTRMRAWRARLSVGATCPLSSRTISNHARGHAYR